MSDWLSFKHLLVSIGFSVAIFLPALVLSTEGQTAVARPARAAAASARRVHVVTIKDMKYQPATLTVEVGDTVEWKNEDIVSHSVTAVNKAFDSGTIRRGHSWELVVKKRGTFDYTCTFHPNMKGVLIVR
jgi:plastocyanin